MPSDYFLITSDADTGTTPSRKVLVYLIPGNPGLIVYYRDFINHLNTILASSLGKVSYTLTGHSLAGFEVDDIQSQRDTLLLPFNLQQQIENVHARLGRAASVAQGIDPDEKGERPAKRLPVILIGHSVGAYMLLEILARRQRAQKAGSVSDLDSRYDIIGGINLFPTVVDLAKSPTGRRAAVSPLSPTPTPSRCHI